MRHKMIIRGLRTTQSKTNYQNVQSYCPYKCCRLSWHQSATARRYIAENSSFHRNRHENFQSHKVYRL